MVSNVKILPVPSVTTAERLALANIAAGNIVFDSDIQELFITNDGGATPTWTPVAGTIQNMQQTYDEGQNINFSASPAGGMAWFSSENSISFSPSPASGGLNYQVNDILTVSGGTAIVDAKIKVDTIGGSGEVLTYTIIDTGLYSVDPSPLTANPLAGGSGSGITVNLNTFQGGSIFFDPGSDGAIDLTGCDHSALRLSLVPTSQEGFLTTTQAGLWFDPDEGVLKYSDGSEIKTIQKLLSFSEGAVLFGGSTGEITEAVDSLFFDTAKGSLSVGASVQDVEISGSTVTPQLSNIGTTNGIFDGFSQINYFGAGTPENNLYFLASGGSQGSEIKVDPGNRVATFNFGGWDGAAGTPSFWPGASIDFNVDDTVNDGSVPIGMSISCNNLNSNTSSNFDMSSNGQIISTASDDAAVTSSIFTLNADGSAVLEGTGAATPTRTLLCDFASNIRLSSSEVTLSNNLEIEGQETSYTGNVIGATYTPETLMRVIADEAIAVGDAVTASTSTDYRVIKLGAGDSDDVLVIGFAKTSSTNPGDEILISGATLSIANNDAVGALSPGDAVKKSDAVNGKITKASAASGVIGLAAASAGVSSSVRIWHARSLPIISGGGSTPNYAQLENITTPIVGDPYFTPSILIQATSADMWEAVTSLTTSKSSVSSTSNGELIAGKTATYKVTLAITAGTNSGGNRRNFWGYTINQPLTDRNPADVDILVGHYSTDVGQPIAYSGHRIIDLNLNDRITLWYFQSGGAVVDVNLGAANFIIEEVK